MSFWGREVTSIGLLPLNTTLLDFYAASSPDSSAQYLHSDISECACFVQLTVALQTQDDGNLFIDHYTTANPNNILYTETIPITGTPLTATYSRNIAGFQVRVRLELDNPPSPGGPLGIFASLRKEYA
jgi:hypothetical protein